MIDFILSFAVLIVGVLAYNRGYNKGHRKGYRHGVRAQAERYFEADHWN